MHTAIVEKIEAGAVTMRSPLHFLFKTIVLISALIGVFLTSTVILNFILFSIHHNSHHTLLGFGPLGWGAFLHFFPWALFCIDVVLVSVVLYLLRSFRFGYKTPKLYLIALLAFGVVVVGTVIEKSSEVFNMQVMHRVEEGRLPRPLPHALNSMHMNGKAEHGLCICEVVTADDSTGLLVARERRSGKIFNFKVDIQSSYATTSGLLPGDVVFIAGEHRNTVSDDDTLTVFGIKRMVRE